MKMLSKIAGVFASAACVATVSTLPAGNAEARDSLDVLILYNGSFATEYEIDTRERIDELMAFAQHAFAEAGYPNEIRIVGVREVDYSNANHTGYFEFESTPNLPTPASYYTFSSLEGALGDVAGTGSGAIDGVHDWRLAAGADLVILIRVYQSSQGACGRAIFPSFNPSSNPGVNYDTGFIAFSDDAPNSYANCDGDFVLAHEMGHSLGLAHNNDYPPGYIPQSARGYTHGSPNWASIMASGAAGADGRDAFSNLTGNCVSTPCGVSGSTGADAASALAADYSRLDEVIDLDSDMELVAAVLPVVRAVQTSSSATFVATLLNTNTDDTETPENCRVELPGVSSGFTYQATTPVSASANTPVDMSEAEIVGGVLVPASQEFSISFSRSVAEDAQLLAFEFVCDNYRSARSIRAVNAAFLTTTSSAGPDVVTQSTDYDVEATEDVWTSFAIATTNVGATGTVSFDVIEPHEFAGANSDTDLPIDVRFCEIGVTCNSWTSSPYSLSIAGSGQPSFLVQVRPTDPIANNPVSNRLIITFRDGSGRLVGGTSVAVHTD